MTDKRIGLLTGAKYKFYRLLCQSVSPYLCSFFVRAITRGSRQGENVGLKVGDCL